MKINENTIISEIDENGKDLERKITPNEIDKYSSIFRYVNIDLPNHFANQVKSWQIQNPVLEMATKIQKDNQAILNQFKLHNPVFDQAIEKYNFNNALFENLAQPHANLTSVLASQTAPVFDQLKSISNSTDLLGKNSFALTYPNRNISDLMGEFVNKNRFDSLLQQIKPIISSLNIKTNTEKILNSKAYLDLFKQGLSIDIELSQTKEKTVRDLRTLRKFESRKAYVDEIEDEFEIQAEEIKRLTTQVLNIDGKPSRVLLVPVDKYDEVSSYYNQISISETDEIKTSLKVTFKGVVNSSDNLVLDYDSRSGLLSIGPHNIIKFRKTQLAHLVLKLITRNTEDLVKEWDYTHFITPLENYLKN